KETAYDIETDWSSDVCSSDLRRMTASARSSSGTDTAAMTTMTGDISARTSAVPYIDGEIRPEAETDAPASIRPMSMAPESPMKMRAGSKLCGRKPRQAPSRQAEIIAGGYAETVPPWSWSMTIE